MRSIRGLALVAFAAAALVAFPASASAFSGIKADTYPATLHGAREGQLVVGFSGGEISACAPNFDASLEAPSPGFTSSSTSVNCGSEGWDMKGCQLTFQPGSETVDVGPSGCGPTQIASGVCGNLKIPAQNGLHASYENSTSEGKSVVLVYLAATGVEYTRGLGCGAGTFKDMTLTGAWKVSAIDAGKKAIGVSAFSGDVPLGIFMAGGSPGTGEPRLDAQVFPVDVVGERWDYGEITGKLTLFEVGKVKASCETVHFDMGNLSGPVYSQITVTPEYGGCTSNMGKTTVKMNSCHYLFSGIDQIAEGQEYEGTPEIACNTGAAIEVSMTGCIVSVPAQALSGSVPLLANDSRSGYDAVVGSIFGGSKVKYTTNNVLACKLAGLKSSGEDAAVESDLLMRGRYPG